MRREGVIDLEGTERYIVRREGVGKEGEQLYGCMGVYRYRPPTRNGRP